MPTIFLAKPQQKFGEANYRIDNNQYAITLEKAIAKAKDNSTIYLLKDYEDLSTATINKNITLDVQQYTLVRTATITVSSSKTVEIIGTGTITNATNTTITNSGNLTINMDGKIENTSTNSSYRAIYTTGGTVTVNKGTVRGGYYSIYAGAKVIINGGSIEGDTAIYQNSNVEIKILGGKVEGKTYGISGGYTNKIIIGDVDSEVNNSTPIVSGGTYGIYMRSTSNSFYFYNGIIMGTNSTPYTQTITPRDGYIVYTYYDYSTYKKYCAVLTKSVDKITIEQTPTDWTNQEVEILVKYPMISNTTMQFSEDGENWKDVDNVYRTNITENKTIYARMLDASGILLESKEHEITNIDKIAPEVRIEPETTKYIIYNQEADSVDINLKVALSDEGGSGIKTSQYAWSNNKEEKPTRWIDLQNQDTIPKKKEFERVNFEQFQRKTKNAESKSTQAK